MGAHFEQCQKRFSAPEGRGATHPLPGRRVATGESTRRFDKNKRAGDRINAAGGTSVTATRFGDGEKPAPRDPPLALTVGEKTGIAWCVGGAQNAPQFKEKSHGSSKFQ